MGKMSLKMKLLLLCGFLSVITVGVGLTSYTTLSSVSQNYDGISEVSVPKMKLAYDMMLSYRQVRIAARTLGLPGLSPAQGEEAAQDVLKNIEIYEGYNTAYLKYGFVTGQKELYENVDAKWKDFKEVGTTVLSLYKAGTPEGHAKMQEIFLDDCPKKAKAYSEAMLKLVDFHDKVAESRALAAKADSKNGTNVILMIILAGLATGLGVGYLLAVKVSRSVFDVAHDLSQGADQVSQAANQIAESSQGLSQSTTEQASSLEETVGRDCRNNGGVDLHGALEHG